MIDKMQLCTLLGLPVYRGDTLYYGETPTSSRKAIHAWAYNINGFIVECTSEYYIGKLYWENFTAPSYEDLKAATAQSEQDMEALRRKLAEAQARDKQAILWLSAYANLVDVETADEIRSFIKAGNEEELTRRITEAEQRGAVKALRGANKLLLNRGHVGAAALVSGLADELEGRG